MTDAGQKIKVGRLRGDKGRGKLRDGGRLNSRESKGEVGTSVYERK